MEPVSILTAMEPTQTTKITAIIIVVKITMVPPTEAGTMADGTSKRFIETAVSE